jgi:hypothetical protein
MYLREMRMHRVLIGRNVFEKRVLTGRELGVPASFRLHLADERLHLPHVIIQGMPICL